jgi:hypothetical protein
MGPSLLAGRLVDQRLVDRQIPDLHGVLGNGPQREPLHHRAGARGVRTGMSRPQPLVVRRLYLRLVRASQGYMGRNELRR